MNSVSYTHLSSATFFSPSSQHVWSSPLTPSQSTFFISWSLTLFSLEHRITTIKKNEYWLQLSTLHKSRRESTHVFDPRNAVLVPNSIINIPCLLATVGGTPNKTSLHKMITPYIIQYYNIRLTTFVVYVSIDWNLCLFTNIIITNVSHIRRNVFIALQNSWHFKASSSV